MALLKNEIFICLDCETTGLEPEKDRIIEVAAAIFQDGVIIEQFESLIDPEIAIPEESMKIHHISNEMVCGKPKIEDVLPNLFNLIGRKIIVGHGIPFDIEFLITSAKRHQVPCSLSSRDYIDTLRLARLYGDSPINSLEKLREHFNIPPEEAHRAMSDVQVNIEVFKYLIKQYKTTEEILERLKKPINLKTMPLGKHKGRPFSQIPVEYLSWASHKDFDQDLLFSIRSELKKRKAGGKFEQAGSPFSSL